jgi:hypothetical protein
MERIAVFIVPSAIVFHQPFCTAADTRRVTICKAPIMARIAD